MAPLPDLGVAWPELGVDETASGPVTIASTDRRYRLRVVGLDLVDPSVRIRFDQSSTLREGEGKPANTAQIERRARQDEQLLREALRAAGHYDADVAIEVAVVPGSAEVGVTITASPGAAYLFDRVTLTGLTPGPEQDAVAAAYPIKVGDTASADRVNGALGAFRAELGRRGYPFAAVPDPAITIDHEAIAAALVQPVTLGARARFGSIVGSGRRPPFSTRHLGVIARFRPGDAYDTALLEDFRRAIINTGLVSIARITPKPTADPGIVDIDVDIERAPPRTISAEFGYGTGEGARAEVSWQHRNLLPPEGSVAFRGILGTREQSLSATLRRSNFHARDRVLTAQLAADHSNFDAYDARTLSVSAGIERQTNIIWQKVWSWSVGAEFLYSDERDTIEATGQPRRRTFLVVAAPGTLAYDASNDLLNPTTGFRLAVRLSPEASVRRGFDGYVKGQVDASAYRPVGRRIVLAGRVRLATIQGVPRDDIAPSRRLYAGGGGSVRGFGYQKIGPVDVNGDPIGGKGLAEAAVEARVRFGDFGIVPFLDMGNLYARSLPKLTGLRYGAGLGARYYTSFGPIRVDVGTPVARRPGESRVAVYVSLGQAF